MERLQATFDKLLRETTSKFHRYMYDRIDWQARIVGLLGPRGVGKTTLILQYLKENLSRKETLYVVAEDLYFSSHTLVDLADAFAHTGGKHLFIDEIHKYKGWSRELKLIYDYHSELHVFFTGSSVLDISKGVADLNIFHCSNISSCLPIVFSRFSLSRLSCQRDSCPFSISVTT